MRVNLVNYKIQESSQKTQNIVNNYTMSVIQETNPLAAFVRKVLEDKDLTTRDVEEKSGGGITHSYVNKIKNGDAKNLSMDTLAALALGLGEPEEVVFALARGKKPNTEKAMNERFELMSLKFAGIKSETKRSKAEVLVDMLDRELEKIANDPD